MAYLYVVKGDKKGQTFGLQSDKVVIGRGKRCEICLQDYTISSKHATILAKPDGTYVIKNGNSPYGTYVDDLEIKMAVLADFAKIKLGSVVVEFRPGEPTSKSAAPVRTSVAPKPRQEGAGDFSIVNIYAAQEAKKKTKDDKRQIKYSKTRVWVLAGIAGFLLIGYLFMFSVSRYKPDLNQAAGNLRPLIDKLASKGMKVGGSGKEKIGYEVDKDTDRVNISGGKKMDLHMGGSRVVKAPEKSDAKTGEASPSTAAPASSAPAGAPAKSPSLPQANTGGANIHTGDIGGGAGAGNKNPGMAGGQGTSSGMPPTGQGPGSGKVIPGQSPDPGGKSMDVDDQELEKMTAESKGEFDMERKTGGTKGREAFRTGRGGPKGKKKIAALTQQDRCRFRINTYDLSMRSLPAIAADPLEGFVVIWPSPQDISGQRYDGAGRPLGDEFRVNVRTTHPQCRPAVAIDAMGNFVVVWNSCKRAGASQDGVFARRFDYNGFPLEADRQINTLTADDLAYPAVAGHPDGRTVVVWQARGLDGQDWGVFGRRFDAAARPMGREFRINSHVDGDQIRPAVAMDDEGGFVVVWASAQPNQSGWRLRGQRHDAAGVPVGGEFSVTDFLLAGHGHPQVTAKRSGDFLVLWRVSKTRRPRANFMGRWFSRAGWPMGESFAMDSHAPKPETVPAVAVQPQGGFVVAWASKGEGLVDWNVYGMRLNDRGVPMQP